MAQFKADSLEVARLCASCQKASFDDTYFPPRSELLRTQYHFVDQLPDLGKLDASAGKGCDFCRFLRTIILSGDTNDLLTHVLGKGIAGLGTRTVGIQIFYQWNLQPAGLNIGGMSILLSIEGGHSIELWCLVERALMGTETTISRSVAEWLSLSPPNRQSYTGDDCIRWLNDRIRNCCDNHSHSVISEGFIPERLLDVHQEPPRLVRRVDICSGPRVKYAALSYCWGSPADSKSQTTTTAATLAQRLAGLEESEMTAILRDAVHITRALSIRYLWIDALCILQGSRLDWEQHCRDMHQIYGSAHVTLCAASSTSCHEGFLSQKGTRIRFPFQSQEWPGMCGSYDVQFKYALTNHELNPGSLEDFDERLCRWAYRAWTFQERLLAPRRIVFGKSRIYLACGGFNELMSTKPDGGEGDPTALSVSQLYRLWDEILCE